MSNGKIICSAYECPYHRITISYSLFSRGVPRFKNGKVPSFSSYLIKVEKQLLENGITEYRKMTGHNTSVVYEFRNLEDKLFALFFINYTEDF